MERVCLWICQPFFWIFLEAPPQKETNSKKKRNPPQKMFSLSFSLFLFFFFQVPPSLQRCKWIYDQTKQKHAQKNKRSERNTCWIGNLYYGELFLLMALKPYFYRKFTTIYSLLTKEKFSSSHVLSKGSKRKKKKQKKTYYPHKISNYCYL